MIGPDYSNWATDIGNIEASPPSGQRNPRIPPQYAKEAFYADVRPTANSATNRPAASAGSVPA